MRIRLLLLMLVILSTKAFAQLPPATAPPKNPDLQKNQQPPSAKGHSHSGDIDPFLKYAENVKLSVTQLDLRDFPTVRAFATAHDDQGIQLRTLQEGDFNLQENGKEVEDLHFGNREQLDLPLAVMFVVDVSGSMREASAIELQKEAIRQFVGQLGPKDRVGLVTFSDAAIPEVPLTTDHQRLLRAVDSMVAFGQTALWDGVFRGMETIFDDDQPARRAMLVLSDGVDNRSVESPQTIKQLYNDKGQTENKGFSVYCMGLGGQVDRGALGSIATATGGLYVDSPGPQDLADVHADILRQIQNEYLLEYTSTVTASPGQIIDIELGLNNVRSFVAARYTYRSPGLAAALGRALWPGLALIGALLAALILTTFFRMTRRSWLTVMITPLEGRDYVLSGEQVEIGRSEVCAIRLARDPSVASLHAALRETVDGWVLEAHDAAAPIIYGKQRLARKLLRHGDAFVLGATSIVFNERIERYGSAPGLEASSGASATETEGAFGHNEPVQVQPQAKAVAPSRLRLQASMLPEQTYDLREGENLIGRNGGQIQLSGDPQVSSRHCVITLTSGHATLSDLGSTNGTWLNGTRLQPGLAVPLYAGHSLRVGSSDLLCE